MRLGRGATWLGLALVWAGYWAPWIAHRAAALNLNGYELAEWITFLPGVRDGSLRLSRFDFLAPLSAIVILTALAAATPGLSSWVRWPARAVGLLGAIAILPEYPFILSAPTDPELRPTLILGIVTIAAVLLSSVPLAAHSQPSVVRSAQWRGVALGLLAAVALGFTARALVTVWHSLAVLFDAPPRLNWGPIALAVGSISIGLGALDGLRRKARST
ncbi:MAG: hypothetical protein HY260_16200 [Chloroflexi bacterium]|nr:hypothetical protein [Chloroflexota bacterium]